MAEQEVVPPTKDESSGGRVEGESLLLPLLQELLDTPDNEQTADSGTESGEDLRGGLIAEVQNVLAKLANSLKSGSSSDISTERRNNLLQLVSRLQNGLATQTSQEKRTNGHGRFARRKKHKRHTVGVTSEELEDARRLIEEFGWSDSITRCPMQRQVSDSAVNTHKVIKNVTPKPYKNSDTNLGHSNIALTKPKAAPDPCYNEQPINKNPSPLQARLDNPVDYTPMSSSKSTNVSTPESDDDLTPARQWQVSFSQKVAPPKYETPIALQTNPIYTKPQVEADQKSNKFASKKLKMKRANTIDIPKAADQYESEEDYDSDTSLIGKQNRRNNYLALRGPIRVVGNNANNKGVPVFEPKTESDKKFMAFLNKHNDSNNKSSVWNQNQETSERTGYNNWSNRFGNIRTNFEKASTSTPTTPNTFTKSAKHFWTNIDSHSKDLKVPGQQRYSWANANENNIVTGTLKVDTTGLDVTKNYKFIPQPLPVNKFSHAPTSAFAALPKKVQPVIEQQSHDLSNITKNIVNSDDDRAPLYLYSPLPLSTPSSNYEPAKDFEEKLPVTAPKFNKSYVSLNNQPPVEKLTAPYLSKSVGKSSTVRQISEQFNKCPSNTDVIMRNSQRQPGSHLNGRNRYSTIMENKNYHVFNNVQPEYKVYKHEPHSDHENTKSFVSSTVHKIQAEPIRSEVFQHQRPVETSHIHEFSKPLFIEQEVKNDLKRPVPASRQYQTQTSQESLKEYEAAVTRVMHGPISHQAVTLQQNSPRGREDHELDAAFNLKTALKMFSDNSHYSPTNRKLSFDIESKPKSDLKRASSLKSPVRFPNFYVNGKPMSLESTEINDEGESIITSKFQIPVAQASSPSKQMLSKEQTWNQIVQQVGQHTPQATKSVVRSKSTHTLAVPTIQFQAGMSKDEVVQKKKSVEAYFSGKISPQSISKSGSEESIDDRINIRSSKSSINRKKTCEKVSIHGHGGVARSRTLPNIVSLNLLDESNVEESFDDLFKSNAA